jgi:hypothetical protein
MATQNLLFHIDTVIVDGAPIAIEDGSGMISGAAGFENDIVPSATGDDFQKRKRVPRLFKTKLQFGPSVDPAKFSSLSEIQITARDSVSKRRVLMPKCSFGSMGEIGGGSVDVTFNVLSALQWL